MRFTDSAEELRSKAQGIYWEEEKDPEERGRAAATAFSEIEDEQSPYRDMTLKHLMAYRNFERIGYMGRAGNQALAYTRAPLSLNVIRNMVDAEHSRITRNRVKAAMQTKGGNWAAKERAMNAEQFATGLALKEGLYDKSPLSFMDCAVTGNGVMKTYPTKKGPCIEHVFAPNVVVDFAEGFDPTLTPAHIYEVKYVPKRTLVKRAGDDAVLREKIMALPTASTGDGDSFFAMQESRAADRVRVIECYYFDPDDETKGVLSIIAGNIEIKGGEWKTGNPYSTMRWSTPSVGWQGMGLAEELMGIQSEINRLVRKMQQAMGLLGNPYVFADRAAAIAKTQITDIPGTIILYNGGKPPKVDAPQTVHPEMFGHLDRLYQRAYEIAGISQLSAHGEKPSGIESGRAMLVYDDIQDSDRFATVHREWSQMHVDVLTKAIRATKGIPGYTVPIYGSDSFEEMTFKDLDLDGDDSWVIHPMAASIMGDTPSGQIDLIDKLKNMGLPVDTETLVAEVLSPDAQSYLRLNSSPKRIIQRTVGLMLTKGIYYPPEPQDNLALALDTAQLMYNEARLLDAPQERLAMVRDYMLACKDGLNQAASKQPAPTGAAMTQVPPQIAGGPEMIPPGLPPGGPTPTPPTAPNVPLQ